MKVPFSRANNWSEFPQVQRAFAWKRSGSDVVAQESSVVWRVRLNDFPDEPCHTLLRDDQEVLHFDDWPVFWRKPTDESPKA